MKTVKTSIWKIVMTSLFIMTASTNTYTHSGETDLLLHSWTLDSYVVEGKKYPPGRKEEEDYILFKEDMTYVSKSEGTEEEGTYILNTNGAYVLMIDGNGEKVKAYIISISKQSLILKYDFDEIKNIEVHYNKSI
jgi:hypothetical protein